MLAKQQFSVLYITGSSLTQINCFASLDCVCVCNRVSLALAFLAPQVYQEYPEVKDTQDQKEIPVSLVALVHLDDLDLMGLQALKVYCSPVTDLSDFRDICVSVK